jgi:hypothetical protein
MPTHFTSFPSLDKPPIKVCVTGAAGQIAYSLVLQLVNGGVFGNNQVLKFIERCVFGYIFDCFKSFSNEHCMDDPSSLLPEIEVEKFHKLEPFPCSLDSKIFYLLRSIDQV